MTIHQMGLEAGERNEHFSNPCGLNMRDSMLWLRKHGMNGIRQVATAEALTKRKNYVHFQNSSKINLGSQTE